MNNRLRAIADNRFAFNVVAFMLLSGGTNALVTGHLGFAIVLVLLAIATASLTRIAVKTQDR